MKFIFTEENIKNNLKNINVNYKFHIIELQRFIAQYKNRKTNFDFIKTYIEYLNEKKYVPTTSGCKIYAMLDICKHIVLSDAKMFELRSIIYKLKNLHNIRTPYYKYIYPEERSVIKKDEYLILLKKARSDRQRCFIQFLYTTGARVSEMTGILFSDCTSGEKHVVIKLRGKGNARMKYKEREVFISLVLFNRIKDIFKGNKYLFETSAGRSYNRSYVSNQLGKLTKKILGRWLSAHVFRHSFTTQKIIDKIDYKTVSKALGHSDESGLKIYDHHDIFNNNKDCFI